MLLSTLKSRIKRRRVDTDVDVLIIGAGISGIGMASHLKRHKAFASMFKHKRITIIERRSDIGGTWDLFRYPGVRSDSDMFTLGFAHRPWLGTKAMAQGHTIKRYIKDTVQAEGLQSYIEFKTSVTKLAWSDVAGYWTATLRGSDDCLRTITARFVVGATGYYDMSQGYRPTFAGEDDFLGDIIHPQQWQDVDYADKKVVVIGSGATAMTLVPALVDSKQQTVARHVTLLQRSPTYVASLPSLDHSLHRLVTYLPLSQSAAYRIVRWRNILTQQATYKLSKVAPTITKAGVNFMLRKQLKGNKNASESDIDRKHFSPTYDPWDQRFCAVPDGDLFSALRGRRADIVTDHIEHFTQTGIALKSGKHLTADLVVSATGLNLQMLGGAEVSVNGQPIDLGKLMSYKAVLIQNIPNMAVLFGYTNASWTLKIDLACAYVVRLLRFMQYKKYRVVTPIATAADGSTVTRQADTIMGSLQAGYIKRAQNVLPKQGDREPWVVKNSYLYDKKMLTKASIKDKWLQFSS